MEKIGEEFGVHWQPRVNPATGAVTGYEALARWERPGFGWRPPSEFIPAAEVSGLITRIDNCVLHKACRAAAYWPASLTVGVNVSAAWFARDEMPAVVIRELIESGLAAERLEVEVKEGVLMRNPRQALRTIERLKRLGVRVALDNFGAGASSLTCLGAFPFDKLKLDLTFVRELTASPRSQALARSVVGLGRTLGIAICAEGVETAEQLAILKAEGCDEIQGFLFGRPEPYVDLDLVTRDVPEPPEEDRQAA